jgi:hypothetical protein
MVESPPRLTDPSGHDAHAPPVRYWVVVHDATAAVHVAAVSTLSVHDVAPDTVYPESHSGWHVEPLARVSVQVPAAPLVGGTAASHSLSLRTHAAGGPYHEPVELAKEPPAFVNATHSACKELLLKPQFLYLACQAVALENMSIILPSEDVSQPVVS